MPRWQSPGELCIGAWQARFVSFSSFGEFADFLGFLIVLSSYRYLLRSNMKVLILLSLVCFSQAAIRLSSVLSPSEQENIRNLLSETPYSDIAHAYYAVSGLKELTQGGAASTAVTKAACEAAKSASTKSLESLFYASSIVANLGATCKHTFPASAIDSVEKKLSAESDVKSLYHAVSVLSHAGKKFSSNSVVELLTKALAQDDSVLSSSLGILITSKLDAKVDIKPLLEKSFDIEDMVNQADEVDEKYLHFENDLRTTSTFIRAALELSKRTKRPLGITEDQMIMLANFILRTKNPSTHEQAFNVVASLNAIASSSTMKLAKVQLLSGSSIAQDKTSIQISVNNVLSHPIEGLTVKADSVTRTSDNEVIISNTPLKKAVAASGTTYDLNMWNLKPKSGFYDVTLNVVPTGGANLVGVSDIEFRVKVTTRVEILESQIGTQDREASSGDWQKVKYPAKGPGMKADTQQKVLMKFKVQDTIDKALIKPHQVFVLFQNVESGQEVIFIAEPDSQSMYKFEVDLSTASKEQFAGKDGKYSVHLIVGDAAISNPILWHVADITLTFTGVTPTPTSESIYVAKPEIHHKFRESEKRPPAVVSTIFTFACLAPLVILLISWLKTGMNLSNLSLAPKNLIFHGGLIGIFVLYYLFWVQLNMFTTLRYLALLGSVTFLAGSKVLADQAARGQ
uniref:dolichyl-diphosphooligosaccharide--protein glycosyltransferase subunit 2-like isoform X2 n=1 Tax=Styela clava TaxID=7725 RepID=UPI00193AA2F6|nr:dolichyl-diphosphooligosaccharide--protein glycosyltransferase subunit 2-like isoform X2 [Styela clava]